MNVGPTGTPSVVLPDIISIANATNRRITNALGREAKPALTTREAAAASSHPEKWQVKGRKSRAGA